VLERLRGISEALVAHGLVFEQCTWFSMVRFRETTISRKAAGSPALLLPAAKFRPRLSPSTHEVAIGAIHGLQEAGLRVPQDVSVAGFNNQDICLMPTPTLTSVDQRVEDTINLALRFCCPSSVSSALASHRQMLDPLLVVRDSTGPARFDYESARRTVVP